MRAEQLLSVAKAVKDHLDEQKPLEALEALIAALEEQGSDPSEETQDATVAAREAFYVATRNSPLDNLPPREAEILASMKLLSAYGIKLQNIVRSALSKERVTPQAAVKKLKDILHNGNLTKNAIDEAISSLAFLEVFPDDLAPDEFEVMVAIPGSAINDELEAFGRETLQINRILSVFSELATGGREPFKLRAIASTDPTLYIYAAAGVASVIVTALEKVTALYEKVLVVVKLQRELSGKVPDKALDPLKKHIDDEVKSGLQAIKAEIMSKYSSNIDKQRKPEIDTELSFTLRELAKRIDEGYLFDVRAGDPPKKDDAAEDGAEIAVESPLLAQREAARAVIAERRPALRHFEAAPEPILGLQGPDDQIPST